MQADILARYKPMINVSLLIPTLKQADKLTANVSNILRAPDTLFSTMRILFRTPQYVV